VGKDSDRADSHGCVSGRLYAGYYNGEGKNDGPGFLQQYPDGAVKFYNMLTEWREAGKMEGLIVQ